MVRLGWWILDPRGTLEPWDATYDFGKMLFSLTVFEPALERGFETARATSSPGAAGYEVRLQGGMAGVYRAAAAHFLDFLTSADWFQPMSRGRSEEWRWRILFAHAFHLIAESA